MIVKRVATCSECGEEIVVEFELPEDLPDEVVDRIVNPKSPYGQYAVCDECLNKRR